LSRLGSVTVDVAVMKKQRCRFLERNAIESYIHIDMTTTG